MSVGFSIPVPQKRRPYRGSVLPRIATQRTRGGTLLTWGGDNLRTVVVEGFGAVVAGIGAFLTIHSFLAAGCFFWFALAMVGYGVWAAYAAFIRSTFRATFFGGAQLRVDRWPIHLGDTVFVQFRRAFKKTLDVSIEASVDRTESVVIGDSDARKVQTHRAFSIPLDGGAVRFTRREALARWTFTIPADQAPSFAVADNAITWSLNVNFRWNDAATAPASFPLLVLPEIRR